jgi:hypothetical protein
MMNDTPDGPGPDMADQIPARCPRLASSRYLEKLAQYAEVMVAHGQEKVEKTFPRLANHLKACSACTSVVEDMLAFLNEPDETR